MARKTIRVSDMSGQKFRTVAEQRSVSRLRTPDAALVNLM